MDDEIPVTTVLEALKLLTTPSTKTASLDKQAESENDQPNRFDQLLKDSIDSLTVTIENDEKFKKLCICLQDKVTGLTSDSTSVRWQLVTHCLMLLDILKQSLQQAVVTFRSEQLQDPKSKTNTAPTLSPDVLGVNQQKTVMTAVQFVICFGICPNLQPGVGVPLEKKTEFGFLIHKHAPEEISEPEKDYRLALCTKVMLECVKQSSLGSLILSRHLGDILAALCQICFSRKKKQGDEQARREEQKYSVDRKHLDTEKNLHLQNVREKSEGEEVFNTGGSTAYGSHHSTVSPADVVNSVKEHFQDQEKYLKSEDIGHKSVCDSKKVTVVKDTDRQFLKEKLAELLDNVYQPLIVRELLILQGGPGPSGGQKGKPGQLVRAPAWLRNACGRMLTDRLLKPNGIQNVIRGMLDGTGVSIENDWKKCDAIAQIIAKCPRHMEPDSYYKLIAAQVTELLHIKDKQLARQFLRVTCSSISAMLQQQPDLTRKYLIQPLMRPLLCCLSNQTITPADEPVVLFDESNLTVCMDDLMKIMVEGCEPSSPLIAELTPVILVMFNLLIYTKSGVSHLRSSCEKLLLRYLSSVDKQTALTALYVMTFGETSNMVNAFQPMHCALKFASGPTGGIVVVKEENREHVLDMSVQESVGSCVVDLLSSLKKDDITADFFLNVLQELTGVISSGIQIYESDFNAATLLQESKPSSDVHKLHKNLMTLSVLGAMCENLGPSCLKSAKHILQFIKVTLERGVQILKQTADEMFTIFESETLTMAMGLLTAVIGGEMKLEEADRQSLDDLLPLLVDIASHHPAQEVKEMASDLRIAVATHGAVWADEKKSTEEILKQLSEQIAMNKNKASSQQIENTNSSSRPKIEVLTPDENSGIEGNTDSAFTVTSQNTGSDSTLTEVFQTEVKNKEKHAVKDKKDTPSTEKNETKLQQALTDLHDPLIPVRGHALIALGHLLKEKDPATLAKSQMLLAVFQKNMDHYDSYIYLAAVKGLESLADRFPDDVIPVLTNQFLADVQVKRSSETRTKIGEVLMRATRNLGDTIPKYRDLLLSTMLQGARDSDELLRASSVSNIAEICRLLRYSIGNIIQEVFHCCSSLLTSDPAVEVRRAAAHALSQLLRGLAGDTLKVLDTVMKDLYRLLKLSYTTEKDDVVRLHIQLALEELDMTMREFLFPKQTLTKKIRVLDN